MTYRCPRLWPTMLHLVAPLMAVTSDLTHAQTTWTRVPMLASRSDHALAGDTLRGRVVLFGGRNMEADTWEWDGTVWQQRFPAVSPLARVGHAMAYDSARGRVVLFGGGLGTWEWDGSNWQQHAPTTVPPTSALHGLAFDSARGRTVMYGGALPAGTTWEWDGTNWTALATGVSPTPVAGHSLAYDAARRRVVFFGQKTFTLAETWEWDGISWVQRTPTRMPPARQLHALAYDSARGRVVLFGGVAGQFRERLLSDTWEWDGTDWTQTSPATQPSSRQAPDMVFDAARGRVVLFGGRDAAGTASDTWDWDGTAWSLRAGPESPPSQSGLMAYDAARGRTVLHIGGTQSTLSDIGIVPSTWEFDTMRWRRASSSLPGIRAQFGMAYDERRGRVVVFGGTYMSDMRQHFRGDLWEWDGSVWLQRSAIGAFARSGAAMAYDPLRGRTVLFGGTSDHPVTPVLNDTWEWDGTSWLSRTPAHSPPARTCIGMVFDHARGRMVLSLNNTSSQDTWEWDGTDWTQKFPATRPAPSCGHAQLTYDASRSRVLLLGSNPMQDAWEWDGVDWTRRTPVNGPGSRGGDGLAYDVTRARTVLYGGVPLGQVWEYGPVNPATHTAFGAGCAGSAGAPALDAQPGQLPWLGDLFALRVQNLPPGNTGLVWLGASRTAWGTIPLPLDLTPIGMGACALRVSPDFTFAFFNFTGSAAVTLWIPNDTSLLGGGFFTQALVADRSANAFGATTSNGGEGVIGAR